MNEDSQITVPPAFVALFVEPGRLRPRLPAAEIAARHEFCEDLATALTERAGALLWDLGITEADVLARVRQGLLGDGAPVMPAEAAWIVGRLAELMGWPAPEGPPGPA